MVYQLIITSKSKTQIPGFFMPNFFITTLKVKVFQICNISLKRCNNTKYPPIQLFVDSNLGISQERGILWMIVLQSYNAAFPCISFDWQMFMQIHCAGETEAGCGEGVCGSVNVIWEGKVRKAIPPFKLHLASFSSLPVVLSLTRPFFFCKKKARFGCFFD